MDTESQNCVRSRLLFDTGSQRSYITTELQVELGLKVIRKENVIIKTFGDLENTHVNLLLHNDAIWRHIPRALFKLA